MVSSWLNETQGGCLEPAQARYWSQKDRCSLLREGMAGDEVELDDWDEA